MYPNEHYVYYGYSEIVTDPRHWNTLYLGKNHKLWKSENGGGSFYLLKEFGFPLREKPVKEKDEN